MTPNHDPIREQYVWVEVDDDAADILRAATQASADAQRKGATPVLPEIEDVADRVEEQWQNPIRSIRLKLDKHPNEHLQLLAAVDNMRMTLEQDGRRATARKLQSLRDTIEAQLNRQGVGIDTQAAREMSDDSP
jgi:prophage DNA circulation protein